MEDHDAVAELLDLREEMAREEDREALVRRQLAQEDAQAVDAIGVEPVGRLVQDEQAPLSSASRLICGLNLG